jgi:hypothetical protein
MKVVSKLSLSLNLWASSESHFYTEKNIYVYMKKKERERKRKYVKDFQMFDNIYLFFLEKRIHVTRIYS